MLFAGNGIKVEMDQKLCHGAHSMWLRFLNSRIAGKMTCFARGEVSFWPKADMPRQLGDVCFWTRSGLRRFHITAMALGCLIKPARRVCRLRWRCRSTRGQRRAGPGRSIWRVPDGLGSAAARPWAASWIAVLRRSSIVIWLSPSARSQLGGGWSRDHALSLAYFSNTSRLYSARTAFREICPFRSLAIFKRSGSVGARDFRLNLAKNLVAGPGVLPNRLSNNPIVTSLVRDMFREPLYCALGTDGPQHHGISRDGCRHPRHCNRDAGRQSTSAARFIAGPSGFFTLTQCGQRPPR